MMTTKLKTYPHYKSSGIEWLGNVPSHWEGTRFKYFLDQIITPSISTRKVALENIESATGRYIETLSEFDGNGIGFIAGDILYGKLRPYLQKVWLAEFDGNAIGDFFVYRPLNNAKSEYIKWLLLSDSFTRIANQSTEGAKMPRVSNDFIRNLSFYLPPIEEQTAIAVYLDEVTAKIDSLIAEKRSQAEDLRKYRTSLITETVTRGLYPDVSLRPSGIDWLGDIPEHWDIIPLKYLVDESLMYGANESPDEETNASNPRYIRITDIDETGRLKDNTFRSLSHDKAAGYMLCKGDILFARSGATAGKTYRFDEDYSACFAGYLIKAKCGSKLNSKYLLFFTNTLSYSNWRNSIFDQSTIQNISADKYNKLPVPLPSLSEQQQIVDYLDEKTSKIDALIKELEAQLSNLATYKQAVITEAVTGNVDVRDWTPKS